MAKLAARRAAEKRRRRRQRLVAGGIGLVVVLGLVGGLSAVVLTRHEKTPAAAATPTAATSSAVASVTPSPPSGPVACGGEVPKAASVPKPQFKSPPRLSIDKSSRYTAVVKTSCGTIEFRLLARQAPVAVNSFVFLARKGFYDGLTFHRVVRDFVIQGGDPTGTGSGGPGYQFKDELNNSLSYRIGTVAMANSGPDTNGSQWFIVAGRQGTTLPRRYTILGQVVKGLDVVRRIDSIPTVGGSGNGDRPVKTVYIERVAIRQH